MLGYKSWGEVENVTSKRSAMGRLDTIKEPNKLLQATLNQEVTSITG